MEKVIALVDCNSFYCSCERLFRPDLRDVPVGVLSNNDGCFVSRTNELKALGVKMGEPYFKVKELCKKNKVAVFSANFSLYTNISDRVMFALAKFAPTIEAYSVDEAFLDLTGFSNYDLDKYCKEIRDTIFRNIGIPVSIGIGSSKTLAKLANNIAKKKASCNGVFSCLLHKDREWALKNTKVESIWGIGSQKAKTLKMMNIKTAKQLRDFKNQQLIQNILTKVGRQTQDELKGISCFKLTTEIEKKKEIISSRTFGSPVFDKKHLRESVASYASLACEKLRKQNSVCASVEVWVRTNPHKDIEQYHATDTFKCLSHTSDTRKIIKYTWDIIDKLFRAGYEYKKALVRISSIRDRDQSQLSFFEETDSEQSESLMKVIDIINTKEGPHTIKSLACGLDNKPWKMQQTLKSKRFVTGWNELATVA